MFGAMLLQFHASHFCLPQISWLVVSAHFTFAKLQAKLQNNQEWQSRRWKQSVSDLPLFVMVCGWDDWKFYQQFSPFCTDNCLTWGQTTLSASQPQVDFLHKLFFIGRWCRIQDCFVGIRHESETHRNCADQAKVPACQSAILKRLNSHLSLILNRYLTTKEMLIWRKLTQICARMLSLLCCFASGEMWTRSNTMSGALFIAAFFRGVFDLLVLKASTNAPRFKILQLPELIHVEGKKS